MVVKSQVKLIKSLQQKKYRNQHGLFVVEGIKVVRELMDSDFRRFGIFTTDASLFGTDHSEVEQVNESELRKMSGLKTPNSVVGVFEIPKAGNPFGQSDGEGFSYWILALDDVGDPGNLGTIIRLCDWFGIRQLVCSETTVDCYNPKTLQASMGSIARVQVGYTDLKVFLEKAVHSTTSDRPAGEAEFPVFGAFMDGDAVHSTVLPDKGILVLGNEANGISQKVETLISKKISIPQYGKGSTESLNVATAAAILLNEIRRDKS